MSRSDSSARETGAVAQQARLSSRCSCSPYCGPEVDAASHQSTHYMLSKSFRSAGQCGAWRRAQSPPRLPRHRLSLRMAETEYHVYWYDTITIILISLVNGPHASTPTQWWQEGWMHLHRKPVVMDAQRRPPVSRPLPPVDGVLKGSRYAMVDCCILENGEHRKEGGREPCRQSKRLADGKVLSSASRAGCAQCVRRRRLPSWR